jgi:thiosulfate/3-mercaptopyruvate sulfurtransferase
MVSSIISTSELIENLDNKNFILLDCRSDLKDVNWGYQDYCRRHIPGSFYIDLNSQLSAPITPLTGRHPLPDPAVFIETVASFGIQPGKQVVAIDTANGTFAARIWWLLRALGHQAVAVLDGGLNKWINEDKEVDQLIPTLQSTTYRYPPAYFAKPFFSTVEIEEHMKDRAYLLIDARAPERFRGEAEPIDAVAGHIPGAVNRPTSDHLKPDGSLKPVDMLRKELSVMLGQRKINQVISYCGSGVTSCFNLLVMEYAGLGEAALYPGSWSEWIRDPARAVEK